MNFKKKVGSLLLGLVMATSISTLATSSNASNSQGAEKIVEGGLVRTTIGAEPDSLDPFKSAASDTSAIMLNVFEGLLGFDEKGALTPGLSSEYKVSEDGLTYTFTLRDGVKFHDGSDLRPEDIIYSYKRYAGIGYEKPLSSKMANIADIKGEGKNIVITLKQKDTSFLTAMTFSVVKEGGENLDKNPIGTGPFKFESYSPGQKVVIAKNENYWNKDRLPKIDKAEFRIMTDPSAVLLALKAGELDFAGVEALNVEGIKAEFDVVSVPQNMVQLMALNNSVKPLDNEKVRQAINYAINKDEIIENVALNFGTKLESNFSPAMGLYFAENIGKYNYDPEKAKSLLNEAGFPNGFKFSVTVPSNYKFHVDTAQVIQAQLSQVGIELEIKQIEWAQWLDEVYTKANYESTIIGFTGKLDPNEVLARYSTSWPKNFVKFSDPTYDELVKKGVSLPEGEERVNVYKELQKILVDKAASVYIMDPNLTLAFRKDLKGFTNYPVRFLDMTKLYYVAP